MMNLNNKNARITVACGGFEWQVNLQGGKFWGLGMGGAAPPLHSTSQVVYPVNKLLQLVDNIDQECRSEGYKNCSPLVQKNAKKILQAMCDKSADLFGYEFDIYPNDEGELAIDCTPNHGCGVLTLCSPDGSVACFQVKNGVKNRFRYQMPDFPYQNLWKMLEELQSKPVLEYVEKQNAPVSPKWPVQSYMPQSYMGSKVQPQIRPAAA